MKTASERFWSLVDVKDPDDCWPWKGGVNKRGYGMFTPAYKSVPAHRFAYKDKIGDVQPYALVCHVCDNKLCCNPLHMFIGTYYDNNHDRTLKGRTRNKYTGPLVKGGDCYKGTRTEGPDSICP